MTKLTNNVSKLSGITDIALESHYKIAMQSTLFLNNNNIPNP